VVAEKNNENRLAELALKISPSSARLEKMDLDLKQKLNLPEYQTRDLEPRAGGKSLLHDDYGFPKVNPNIHNPNDSIPELKSVPEIPISVKASNVFDGDDDGFFPPKANFVSVGATEEHTWYPPSVTGVTDSSDDQDEIDVESLQGLNPLPDLKINQSALYQSLKNDTLEKTNKILETIQKVKKPDVLSKFKNTLQNSLNLFSAELNTAQQLSGIEQKEFKEWLNSTLVKLQEELDSRILELVGASETIPVPEKSEQDEEQEEEFPEGSYLLQVISSGRTEVIHSRDKLISLITQLVMNGVELTDLQVIKRIKLDFGVLLNE